jgi:hypothetical protein
MAKVEEAGWLDPIGTYRPVEVCRKCVLEFLITSFRNSLVFENRTARWT